MDDAAAAAAGEHHHGKAGTARGEVAHLLVCCALFMCGALGVATAIGSDAYRGRPFVHVPLEMLSATAMVMSAVAMRGPYTRLVVLARASARRYAHGDV